MEAKPKIIDTAMSTITVAANNSRLKVVVGVLAVSVLLYIAYSHISSRPTTSTLLSNAAEIPADVERITTGSGILREMAVEEIPEHLLPESDLTSIKHTTGEGKGVEIQIEGTAENLHYREAVEVKRIGGEFEGDVLLLHGANFDANTWLSVGTLGQLAKLGYRTIAIDLPGYGGSQSVTYAGDPVTFLENVMKELNLNRPVLISPSMSGEYSLPLVLHRPELVRAFVAVAPVGTDKFSDDEYKNCQVPTLIVYGDQDTGIGLESLKHLENLPHKVIEKLVDAEHPAYISQPERWHQILYNFLKTVPK
ncbi:putative protein-lysine deacylase ABHD14B [Glandiceps talaboti]